MEDRKRKIQKNDNFEIGNTVQNGDSVKIIISIVNRNRVYVSRP